MSELKIKYLSVTKETIVFSKKRNQRNKEYLR